MKTSHRIAGLAAAALVTTTMLTGCAVTEGLSHAASCASLADAAVKLRSAESSLSNASSDPAAAATTLSKAIEAFEAKTKTMRDANVKAKADAVTTAMRTLLTDLQQASVDPANADATKLQNDVTAISTAADAAKSACTS